jgi:predicted transcriptional regulator
MNTDQLIAAGLNSSQAEAYLLLLELGKITPPEAATKLKITRSNAYKVLDKLTEMRLAKREEVAKKFVYEPTSPTALSNLVAEQRNIANVREEAVKNIISDLLAKYHSNTEQPDVQIVTGRQAVIDAYKAHIAELEPIYLIRSSNDLPVMGFDTMHQIRAYPAQHGVEKYAITPDMSAGAGSPERDARTKLHRTWARQEDYNAPVEWSVSGSSLLIVLFGKEPHAITITNPLIADAFRQIWQMINTMLQAMPYYKSLPRS